MRPAETIASLEAFHARGAGTDAERRAAVWLCRALGPARSARLEPFWCRPNWALAHAWHLALGLAGSLTAVGAPRIGGGLVLLALLSTIADALKGASLGRLLTPERASQNVVSEGGPAAPDPEVVHLVVTANYDAGRCGLIYRDGPRRAAAKLAKATGRRAPGWLGWACITYIWLIVVAVLRAVGSGGTALDLIQLLPTVGLLLGLALLLEHAASHWSPAAGDNGSGVAAAIALVRALDAAPPSRLIVELVLQGASEGNGTGLSRYLRARRQSRRAPTTIVIGFAPCGANQLRWWLSDGTLVPRGYFKNLRQMCAAIAAEEPQLQAGPHRGRGHTPALRARSARLPAIALGALDRHGLAPRSHQPQDTADKIDPAAIDQAVEFGLLLVDRIDAFLASRGAPGVASRTNA